MRYDDEFGAFLAPLGRLAGTLTVLRDRVGQAVAGELGQAVGASLGEILVAVLRRGGRDWDDDRPPRSYGRDPWADGSEELPRRGWATRSSDGICDSTPWDQLGRCLALGAAVTRFWVLRDGGLLLGVGLGLLGGLLSLASPLVAAGLAAAAGALDLASACAAFTDA